MLSNCIKNLITGIVGATSVQERKVIVFGARFLTVEKVQNNSVLPIGGIQGSMITMNDTWDFINGQHRELLSTNPTMANSCVAFDFTDDARIFYVTDLASYTELLDTCGEYLSEDTMEFNDRMVAIGSEVKATKLLDWENACNYYDVITFTTDAVKDLSSLSTGYDLYGMAYSRTIILNENVITNMISKNISIANIWYLEDVVNAKELVRPTITARPQVKIRKININQFLPTINKKGLADGKAFIDNGDNHGGETPGELTEISMSMNRLFRMYPETRDVKIGDYSITEFVSTIFTVVEMVSINEENDKVSVEQLLTQGFYDLSSYLPSDLEVCDRHFQVCLQSPSQSRQGKFIFCSVDRDEVRSKMVYGHSFGDSTSIPKMEARTTLGLTSTTLVGSDFTYKVIDDTEFTLNKLVTTYDPARTPKVIEERKDVKFTPTDGMGTVEILDAMKIALKLKTISKRQYNYFCQNYTCLSDVKDVPRMLDIFEKLPSAFQIRHAGDKGMLVVFPHSEYGITESIVLNKSMRKYEVESGEVTQLEIANWNKAKKPMTLTNYQALTCLDITGSDLITLVNRALDEIRGENDGILKSAKKAKKFLGMIGRIGTDNDDTDKTLVNKVAKILATDSAMISDKKVQMELIGLLKKYINDLSIGRIPVKGSCSYLTIDPRIMFMTQEEYMNSTDTLKDGENYYNGAVGMHVGARNPLNHSSEVCGINMVRCDSLWFMKDLIVLNPFDDTLPRATGADVDGDKMFVSAEHLLVKSLPKYIPFNYSPAMGGHEKNNDWDHITEHFKTTSTRDRVGKITNLAGIFRDMGLHHGNGYLYNEVIVALSFMQGWEIDKAKTGFEFDMPDWCMTKKIPHWIAGIPNEQGILEHGVKQLKSRSLSAKAEIYHSNSPMGQLFDYVNNFKKELKDIIVKEDRTLKFAMHCNMAEAKRITPAIKALEHDYRLELSDLSKAIHTKEEVKELQSAIYNKYSSLLSFVSTDSKAIAYAVYQTSYVRLNNESKSLSMPWTCAFNGMMELLYMNGNSEQLVKLPRYEDDLIESVIVNNTGMLFINDCPVRMTNYPAGVYEIIIIEDDKYISVPREEVIQIETVKLTDVPFYNFRIKGFSHYSINAIEAIKLIELNNNQFSLVYRGGQYINVFVGSKQIATVEKGDNELCQVISNKQFSYVENSHSELLFVPKKINSTTTMHTDGVHAINNNIYIAGSVVCAIDPKDSCYDTSDSSPEESYNALSYDDCSSYQEEYTVDPSSYVELQYEDYESMMNTEAVAEESAVYSSEPVITKVTTAVEVLNATIVAKLAKQSYWNVKSLVKPAVVDSYTVTIATKTLKANVLVGTVNIMAKGKPYSFNVVVNDSGKGLILVTANMPKSQDMIDWIFRVVTYNFYL